MPMRSSNLEWGLSLEQYASSYSTEVAGRELRWNPELDVAVHEEALRAINQISMLAGERKFITQGDGDVHITLHMLKCVHKLYLSPDTLIKLASPNLMSGCIKLMESVQCDGKPSPFYYEYGYLCFRIFTIALGLCLLERSHKLDWFAAALEMNADTEVLSMFDKAVAEFVQDEFYSGDESRRCDWIFGFAVLPGYPNPRTLVRHADLRSLLHMFHQDQKHLFAALTSTYAPGLAGIMFVLLRSSHFERSTHSDKDRGIFATAFCELIWRYIIIARWYEHDAVGFVQNGLGPLGKLWRSRVIDLEDSRNVIATYNRRIASVDRIFYAPLSVSVLSIVMTLVISLTIPGTEDLLPSFMGLTIRRLWEARMNRELTEQMITDCTARTFINLSRILAFLQGSHLDRKATIPQVIDALIQNDFVDLIARTMMRLNPGATTTDAAPSYTSGGNSLFLISGVSVCEELGKGSPQQLLRTKFFRCNSDWTRYHTHFRWRRALRHTSPVEVHHFDECIEWFDTIRRALGQLGQSEPTVRGYCAYVRCAFPAGAELVCPQCLGPSYCSPRCQEADWVLGDSRGPHRDLCAHGSVEAMDRTRGWELPAHLRNMFKARVKVDSSGRTVERSVGFGMTNPPNMHPYIK